MPTEAEYQALLDKLASQEKQLQAQDKMFEMMAKMQEQIESMQEQMEMFSMHFGRMYASQNIEETLQAMSDLGTYEIGANECTVYSVDAFESSKLFTVNLSGGRDYLTIEDNTLLYRAISEHAPILMNNYSGQVIGDKRTNDTVDNLLVVPLEDHKGDVIGLVVAKDKEDGFVKEDIHAFNLKDGKIGNTFRMGLENKALLQKATTDELTHLQNREGMKGFIKSVVLDRALKREPTSVILFDIDHFKKFNDTFGHQVGDKCLKQVADTIKENFRMSSDSGVFRWGGEEMLLMLPVDEHKATEIADRIRQAVANKPFEAMEGVTTSIHVSAGVAEFKPENIYDLDKESVITAFQDAFEKMDTALYYSKEHGRNRVTNQVELRNIAKTREDMNKALAALMESEDMYLRRECGGYMLIQNEQCISGICENMREIMDNDEHGISAFANIKDGEKNEILQRIIKNIDSVSLDRVAEIIHSHIEPNIVVNENDIDTHRTNDGELDLVVTLTADEAAFDYLLEHTDFAAEHKNEITFSEITATYHLESSEQMQSSININITTKDANEKLSMTDYRVRGLDEKFAGAIDRIVESALGDTILQRLRMENETQQLGTDDIEK